MVSKLVWLDRVDFSRSGCKDFSLLRLCVFFSTACQQKRGLRWCLLLLYQPAYTSNRQISRLCLSMHPRFIQTTLTISLKMLRFYAFSPFLRSRVTADAPSAYTTLLPGCPSPRKVPLPATFHTNLSTNFSRFLLLYFKYV